jgi:hypothetical protein
MRVGSSRGTARGTELSETHVISARSKLPNHA